MAALFTGSARGLGILGVLLLLTECGGHAHTLSGDPAGAGGRLASVGGALPSASGSSDDGTSGVAGRSAFPAGNTGVGGAAQAGFPGRAGSPGSAAGGTAGTAAGGTGGTITSAAGASGSGGAAVFDISPAAQAACSGVCSKFNTPDCVTIGDLGQICQSDCGSSFAIQSGACTALGLEMMSCITQTTPIPNLSDCWIRFYDVTQQCYREVNAYKKCVVDVGAGPLPATLCAQVSYVGPADPSSSETPARCSEDRKCLNGLNYRLECHDTADKQSSCSCTVRDRPIKDFVWLDSTLHACQDALPSCLAAAAPLAPVAP